MSSIMSDSHIRQRALDPTQSFIVQAPAGSGKTEILTQRYLVLLAHAQKAPEEIIAITFTRKAAAEMRARVMQALAFAQTPEPDKNDYRHTTWQLAKHVLQKEAQLNWSLIDNPNRLRILTIDALSAFLCRQTPLLTHFGGSPAVCENASAFYQLAAQRVLTDENTHLEHLLLHLDNNVSTVENLLAHLLSHRDQWLPHILFAYKNQQSLRTLLENSLQKLVVEKLQIAANAMPAQVKQTLILLAQHAGDYFILHDPDHVLAACADFTAELKSTVDAFPSWLGLANLLLTKEGTWRKSIDIRSGFSPKDTNKTLLLAILTELQEHEAFKESLCDILYLPPITYTELQWETLKALTELLPLLAAQLTLVFQEKGQIDFIELNLAALKALGTDESPTDLALYLDYQIQHLLIDEFQDTSVVHIHLLEKIMTGWQADDGRTLFVVGDPMQSIYRFRNAEVGLFLRAQQQGIANIVLEPLTLTMNFRSQPNLVSWFNNTFKAIFPVVSDIALGCVPYTHAIAAKPAINENGAHFYPITSDNNQDEAKLLVEKIKIIQLKNPTDSIAILVRARAQLIPIIRFLQAESLSFQAIDIEPLADRTEIRDLLSLTRALLHRADRIAWLAILRAPFCGLTLADLDCVANICDKKTIWEALMRAENCAQLSADGLLRIQCLRTTLKKAFSEQYQNTLSQWIENTWVQLLGPACLSSVSELNNTRAYFNLLSKMENDETIISIEPLTEQCKRLFANADNANNASIHIMTIHKSKGLEYDHVFLPGLAYPTPPNKEKLFRWLERPNASGGNNLLLAPIKSVAHQSDPLYDYLKRIENQKQDVEITRLLYVATTRAKKSIHLFANINGSAGRGSFLSKLWSVYESIITTHLITPSTPLENIKKIPSLFTRLIQEEKLIPDVASEIVKPVKIDIALHSQQSRIIGIMIHELFQTIAQTSISEITVSRSRLLSLGLLPHEIPVAIHKINIALKNVLSDERGQWILSNAHTDAHCEWALTHLHENEIHHCMMDRSFIDKHHTRWIIDYKTSSPADAETLDDFLRREKKAHETQLNNYAVIITHNEKNPIKLGLYFPLCVGWIEWVYRK